MELAVVAGSAGTFMGIGAAFLADAPAGAVITFLLESETCRGGKGYAFADLIRSLIFDGHAFAGAGAIGYVIKASDGIQDCFGFNFEKRSRRCNENQCKKKRKNSFHLNETSL